MAWKPKPMKIQCHQCKKIGIFAPKSDVILGFPRCKKCGMVMKVVGKVTLLDWVIYPLTYIRNI